MKKIDKPLLFLSVVMFVFGLIMILSASSMESYMRYANSPYYYFFKQAIFLIGGIVIFLIVMLIPLKFWKKTSLFFVIIITISLFLLTIYGHTANNAASWFNLGFISVQPSELIKVFLIIYIGTYYGKNKNNLNNQFTIIKPFVLTAIIVGTIASQPDFGTAFIIIMIVLMMFYSIPTNNGEKKLITKTIIGGLLLCIVILLVTGKTVLRDYQLERFNFLNPCDRYQDDSGYQLCNSFIAFKNGDLTGQGIGKSTQKYLYLPESYTDFIFPIIVEEWGLFVGILIIVFYAIILYRILKIARNCHNLGNSLITYGVFAYIFLHITINLVGVMGLAPLTGVPLPFLSYGGSYCLSLVLALSIVQKINMENYKYEKKIKLKRINDL